MSHVESTNSFEVHPGGRVKKYIPTQDCYKNDDYLTGNQNQKVPAVGHVDTSPVRGKRHVTKINPHSARENQEQAKDLQRSEHNRARGERLHELEHRNEHVNGFGDGGFVSSRKPVEQADNSKESHSRNLRETRYYTEQANSNRVTARAYGSNIGYVQFDYSAPGNHISYAKDAVPAQRTVRQHEGLATSREFLAIDPENAPRNVSPQRRLVKNYEARHNHGMNIISNETLDATNPPVDVSPRRRTNNYEQRYQRNVNIISNKSADGFNSSNSIDQARNSRRYAARDAYTSKNNSNPIAHMTVLDGIPTASAAAPRK